MSFAIIANRGRAMMIGASMPYGTRYKLFREAFTCAIMLGWLVIAKINDKTAMHVELWCGELTSWTNTLHTWGEAWIVKVKTKTMPKLSNKGIA
eukprot:12747483-Ditylum_brightwellii.AAC.1